VFVIKTLFVLCLLLLQQTVHGESPMTVNIHRTHLWQTMPLHQWPKGSAMNGRTCSWWQPRADRRDCSGSGIDLLANGRTSV